MWIIKKDGAIQVKEEQMTCSTCTRQRHRIHNNKTNVTQGVRCMINSFGDYAHCTVYTQPCLELCAERGTKPHTQSTQPHHIHDV